MKTLTPLTEHFSWAEVEHSDTADAHKIDNTLPASLGYTVINTANCMERVRAALGNNSITVSSWYRSLQVNRLVGSKDTSQHIKGEAVDFICLGFGNPIQICKKLMALKDLIRFDQLILEHSWIHISFAISPASNRGQVLSLLSTGGYAVGLTDTKGNQL